MRYYFALKDKDQIMNSEYKKEIIVHSFGDYWINDQRADDQKLVFKYNNNNNSIAYC